MYEVKDINTWSTTAAVKKTAVDDKVHAFGSTDTATYFGASAYKYQDVGPSAYAYASASAAAADSVCGYASGSDFVATYASASDLGQSEVMGRVMVKVMVKFVALSTPRTKVIIQHPIQTACSHCKSFKDLIS